MTRLIGHTTLAEELSLGEVTEAELLGAMGWLLERQERVEKALARRHLHGEGFVLYDLSSSYLEGRHCELGAVGYSRDGKPGTPQISYGLCSAPEGQPFSIEVHKGNTGDPTTLLRRSSGSRTRSGSSTSFVGDRGMITEARTKVLTEQAVGLITSLRAPQIQKLTVGRQTLVEICRTGLGIPGSRLRKAPGRSTTSVRVPRHSRHPKPRPVGSPIRSVGVSPSCLRPTRTGSPRGFAP